MLYGVIAAVQEMHAMGMMHRDIFARNIFFKQVGDTIYPKLADFGMACCDESMKKSKCMKEGRCVECENTKCTP